MSHSHIKPEKLAELKRKSRQDDLMQLGVNDLKHLGVKIIYYCEDESRKYFCNFAKIMSNTGKIIGIVDSKTAKMLTDKYNIPVFEKRAVCDGVDISKLEQSAEEFRKQFHLA